MIFSLWVKFIVCAVLIVIFGFKLSKIADDIVKMGKLSEGLMGVFILALITSFPEVWISVASVVKVNAPDLAIGDLIGSVVLNIMIIAVIDYKYGRPPILSSVNRYHLVTCSFSLLLLGILIASLSSYHFAKNGVGLFNVGMESFFILFAYIFSIRYINRQTQRQDKPSNKNMKGAWRIYLLLILYAMIIIGSSFWLAAIGKEIVDIKGWDQMYFGTIMMAFATSLPEIMVSISAVSIGAPDMAIANILGSNLFNISIIPIADILFQRGYIIGHISISHIYSTLLAIILTIIVFAGIFYRPKKSFMRLGIGTIILIFTFIIGNVFLSNIVYR